MKDKTNEPKPFVSKPENLGAAGMALIAGLTGSIAADAQEVRRDFPLKPVAASTQLEQAPKQHVYVGRPDRMPQSADEIAQMAKDLQKKLSPGGIYHEDFNDPTLTDARFEEIVDRIQRVSALLMIVRSDVIPPTASTLKYMPERMPGLKKLTVHLTDGKLGWCNALEYTYQGGYFEATAAHCLENTVEASQYRILPERDLAIRRIGKRSQSEVFEITDDMTDDAVNGHVAVVQTTNRYGIEDEFHTFVIKMTRPVANIIKRRLKYSDESAKAMLDGFWYVMPPEEGERALLSTEANDANFKGRSGGSPFAVIPGVGAMVVAPFSHGTTKERVQECAMQKRGVCLTFAFTNSGPDALRAETQALIEEEARQVERGWKEGMSMSPRRNKQ